MHHVRLARAREFEALQIIAAADGQPAAMPRNAGGNHTGDATRT